MSRTADTEQPFSDALEEWLKSHRKKTFGSLFTTFGERSFAIAFVLLLFVAAIPAPTGGVTHVFEIIAMLLALELLVGRDTLWLPRRWRDKEVGAAVTDTALPFVMRRIRWLEGHSKPRLGGLFDLALAKRLLALVVLGLTVAAFVAPPFSGLDTLPALGVVLIGLSMVLEDALFTVLGLVAGAVGIALEILLASAVVSLL